MVVLVFLEWWVCVCMVVLVFLKWWWVCVHGCSSILGVVVCVHGCSSILGVVGVCAWLF